MKTRSYYLSLIKQVVQESSSFRVDPKTGKSYLFMMEGQLTKHLREYSSEWNLGLGILNNYAETGIVEYTPFQYELFPMNTMWGDIDTILKEVDRQGMILALGHRSHYSGKVKWQKIIEVPDILRGEIKYAYAGHGHIYISNPEILEEWGIVFPAPNKDFTNPVVAMQNYISAGYPETMDWESITDLGWWSSDYSGYGSLVLDPFNIVVDVEWLDANIRTIGYMATDISKQMALGYSTWQSYTEEKFLVEEVLPFFINNNLGIRVADGSYSGRPLGMKRGAEDSREIFPEKIEDLEALAELGTFVQDWLKKQPVS